MALPACGVITYRRIRSSSPLLLASQRCHMPTFCVEYAKSGRSSCKQCKTKVPSAHLGRHRTWGQRVASPFNPRTRAPPPADRPGPRSHWNYRAWPGRLRHDLVAPPRVPEQEEDWKPRRAVRPLGARAGRPGEGQGVVCGRGRRHGEEAHGRRGLDARGDAAQEDEGGCGAWAAVAWAAVAWA